MIDSPHGNGCDHCIPGRPIEKVRSRGHIIKLCLECVLGWFPGYGVAWWEERHAPYADYVRGRDVGVQLAMAL